MTTKRKKRVPDPPVLLVHESVCKVIPDSFVLRVLSMARIRPYDHKRTPAIWHIPSNTQVKVPLAMECGVRVGDIFICGNGPVVSRCVEEVSQAGAKLSGSVKVGDL